MFYFIGRQHQIHTDFLCLTTFFWFSGRLFTPLSNIHFVGRWTYLNQLLVLYPLVEEFFERGEFDKIFTKVKQPKNFTLIFLSLSKDLMLAANTINIYFIFIISYSYWIVLYFFILSIYIRSCHYHNNNNNNYAFIDRQHQLANVHIGRQYQILPKICDSDHKRWLFLVDFEQEKK